MAGIDQIRDTIAAPDPTRVPVPGEPLATKPAVLTADPSKEYVAGGALWLTNYLQALSWAIDDTTTIFGDDLYDRMGRDPMIAACVNIIKAATLEDGVRVTSPIQDREADGYARAKEIAEACERMLADLTPSLDDVLWTMLDAMAYGNKVAEQVYDDGDVNGSAGLVLTKLKVKPRRSTAFVVDSYRNVVGLLGLVPGDSTSLVGWGAIIDDPETKDNLFPREKFAVLSWRPHDSDPRGTSLLRPAYTPWTQKVETWTQYRKFMAQHASPIPIGLADPSAPPGEDDNGNMVTPQQAMLAAFQQYYHSGSAMAFAGGDVKTLFNPDGGANFITAFGLFDAQMSIAILHQTLAQGGQQAAHSRAASEVHERVTDSVVAQAKLVVPRMLGRDVARPWVRYNFGEQDARDLVPVFTLGETEPQNFADDMTGLGHVNYTLDKSQFPGIDRKYNLPERDPASLVDDPALSASSGVAETPPGSDPVAPAGTPAGAPARTPPAATTAAGRP